MDLSGLDDKVQFFCSKGVADSTHRTYQSAVSKFHTFCSLYNIISPFPVSESILCYFTTYLACQNLCPQTIKTYLAGIRHMQVALGLPEPRVFSSLPRLKLVQAGVQRTHALPNYSPYPEEDERELVIRSDRYRHHNVMGSLGSLLLWLLQVRGR